MTHKLEDTDGTPKKRRGNPAFVKGHALSGGRTFGHTNKYKMHKRISKDLIRITEVLIEKALEGDVQAANILICRAVPGTKPQEQPLMIPINGSTLAEKAASVVDAIAGGLIGPNDGKTFLDAIAQAVNLAQAGQFVERVEEIERRVGIQIVERQAIGGVSGSPVVNWTDVKSIISEMSGDSGGDDIGDDPVEPG